MKKSFHYLWVSQLCANFGDVLYIVGLISILFKASASPFVLALLPIFNMAGRMASSSFGPYFFNRWRLKSVLVYSQLLKTIFLLLLGIGLVYTHNITFIFTIVFLVALCDGLAQPASSALLPRLVEKEKLLRANSLLSMVYETTQLGGWALGGVLVAFSSGTFAIWLTLLLYVLSTVTLLFIIDSKPFVKKQKEAHERELTEGFVLIFNDKAFRAIHVMIVFESIANVAWIAAIMYVFVANVLHVSEAWWGYINTSFFIGLLIGGLICAKFARFLDQRLKNIVATSAFVVAIVLTLFGVNESAIIALLLSALYGFFDQLKGILLGTWLQQHASDDDLAKIYSAQGVLNAFLFGISTFLAGMLAGYFNIQWVYIGGGLLLLASAIYFVIVRHRFKAI